MTQGVRRGAVLCGMALMVFGISACGSDETPSTQSEPWKLGRPDVISEDMGEDLGEQDLGTPDMKMPGLFTGIACESGDQCEGGTCFEGERWPGGYCSQPEGRCEARACAAQDGRCSFLGTAEPTCVRPCESQRDCRFGYTCEDTGDGFSACLGQEVLRGNADGEACQQDSDCAGGTCLPEEGGGGLSWPQGYCTTLGCDTREDCASPSGEDNRCYRNPQGPNLCVRICFRQDECREGYQCQPVDNNGTGFCVPGEAPRELEVVEDFSAYPFAISCQGPVSSTIDVAYTTSPGISSYMFTPFALDLGRVRPQRITTPTQQIIDFNSQDHQFQAATSQFFGFINPTLMAGAPQFASTVESGVHAYRLRANSQNLCSYLIEEKTPGTTIDLNIYFVGVNGVDAASAPMNANIQSMLAAFNGIYQSANVQVGQVKYFDITGEDAQRYAVLRSDTAAAELPTLSTLQGTTYDDALSLNIFFVRAFAMEGGAIGVSLGLPGPAGLHGTPASGVVFTSEFLGRTFNDRFGGGRVDGNKYTGIVMAHEVGHYLGLFHTTEQNGQAIEPLADTPQCTNFNDVFNCPDINNLMFPFAGITHTEVSMDQASVIQSNPLTKD